MPESTPVPGEVLTSGLLYRRIPNKIGFWDPDAGLPQKMAFAPGCDRETGERETGISAYWVELTSVEQVLDGHDPNFGVAVIDIAALHRAVEELRPRMGTGHGKVKPFGELTVKFEPSVNPRDGAARHAHCWVDPVPLAVQKQLVRMTNPAMIAKPCGPLRPESGAQQSGSPPA